MDLQGAIGKTFCKLSLNGKMELSAAPFLACGSLPLVGEQVLDRRQEKRPKASLTLIDRSQRMVLEQPREEFLG